MNIILIGFMGAGKSTVAKHLSQQLGFSCLEMDELVCQKTSSQDMHEVFRKGGELLLRETEIAIAKKYAPKKNWVISTGGGVVLNKIVLDYFKENKAKVVFLNTPFERIVERLRTDLSRPLFDLIADVRQLYEFRLPLYRRYADQIIDADLQSLDEIVGTILVSNGF